VTAARVLAELNVATAETMHEFGLALARVLQPGDLVLLTGPLGAGKTTLTRGVGEGLGVVGSVSSPTFVIARTHHLSGEKSGNAGVHSASTPFVHVDAYRLGTPAELDDLDIDFANSIVLVEWGLGFTDGISESWLEVEIERDHTGETEVRAVKVSGFGPRWQDAAAIEFGGAA
jgi:tRNA threonylcarbamoyladenosine biosynthesis protein TsaE